MIDRTHPLSLTRQAEALAISRGIVSYGANNQTSRMILLSDNITDNLFGNGKRHTTFPSPRNCPGQLA